MKKWFFVTVIIALILCIPAAATAEGKIDNVREVMNIILDNYKGDITREELEEAAFKGGVRGMFAVLDKNSSYYDKDSIASMGKGLDEYVGIGARITIHNSRIIIEEVVKGYPVQAAGLRKGDEIVLIDGSRPGIITLDGVVALLKGPAGSDVKLTMKRDGAKKEFTITREEIRVRSEVIGKVENVADSIKYIEIKNFNSGVYSSFSKILKQSERDGTRGLIIDLRDNKGGILDEVIKICQDIVPGGTIVSVENKDGEMEEHYSWLEEKKYEILILVNRNSASASEILASAVKESGAGIIIGERTYGKGTVQKVFKDKDGNYLKITTGEYFTRKGNKIDGTGLEPDIGVKVLPTDCIPDDIQLNKAIEYLSRLFCFCYRPG